MSDKQDKPDSASKQPVSGAKPKQPVGPQRIPARGEAARSQSASSAASPQRVGAPEQGKVSRRWLGAVLAALMVFAAVGVAGLVYLSGDRAEDTTQDQIRTSIESFTEALSSGDLETLRTSSCGDLQTYYRDISDADFAEVHRAAVEQGNIPIVEAVEAVQINGESAIAQVEAYTEANPGEKSPRTFDLRLVDEEWKVC